MTIADITAADLQAALAGNKSLCGQSASPAETRELAGRLAQLIIINNNNSSNQGDVITLIGDLGSGKTTFVQGFCAALGVTGKVTSPTFTLMHVYHGTAGPIYHFDFYRLNSTAEIAALGFEEYWEGGGVSLIEWPQLASPLLPDHPLSVRFSMPDFVGRPETREIKIERVGRENVGNSLAR